MMRSNFEFLFFAATESGVSYKRMHTSVPKLYGAQFYTLVLARNFLVLTESQAYIANFGQQSEKMGSVPLTHSLRDSNPWHMTSIMHGWVLLNSSNSVGYEWSKSSILELIPYISHYQSIRMSCQCSVLILLAAFYTCEVQVLPPVTLVWEYWKTSLMHF